MRYSLEPRLNFKFKQIKFKTSMLRSNSVIIVMDTYL